MLLVAGCSASGPTQDGCDVCTTSAVVSGTVRDTAGNGVPGALVTVRVFSADTARPQDNVSPTNANNPVRTDLTGAFRAQPITPLAPFRARVVVTVAPPAQYADTSASGAAGVEFRADSRGVRRDSTRVDVVVRRRGA